MEVRAITDGFYGGARRRAGTTFQVAEGETSKWFEPTNADDAKPKGKGVNGGTKSKPATDGAGDLV
jgi:hypothetical protein